MADEKNLVQEQEQEDGDLVVIMTDEEGNEFYYREEVMIPIGNKKFAVLVSIEEEDTCNCGCHAEVNNDVFVARIDVDEDGEEVYVDPTDEEFDMVCAEYNKLIEEEAE